MTPLLIKRILVLVFAIASCMLYYFVCQPLLKTPATAEPSNSSSALPSGPSVGKFITSFDKTNSANLTFAQIYFSRFTETIKNDAYRDKLGNQPFASMAEAMSAFTDGFAYSGKYVWQKTDANPSYWSTNYCCPTPDQLSRPFTSGPDFEGLHVFERLRKINPLRGDGSTWMVVDVGANIGKFSLAIGAMGFDVLSFEPIPLNFHLLTMSILANRFDRRMCLIQAAVGDVASRNSIPDMPSFLKIYSNEAQGLDSSSVLTANVADSNDSKQPGRQHNLVPVVVLDEILPSHDILFLKADVQGYEGAVLRGMLDWLRRGFRSHLMLWEVGFFDGGGQSVMPCHEFIKYLQGELDYDCGFIANGINWNKGQFCSGGGDLFCVYRSSPFA